jgi:hypothetical protein
MRATTLLSPPIPNPSNTPRPGALHRSTRAPVTAEAIQADAAKISGWAWIGCDDKYYSFRKNMRTTWRW